MTTGNSYFVGQVVRVFAQVKDVNQNLIDATVMTITFTKPNLSTTTPTVTHDGTGLYHADVTTDQTGAWSYKSTSTGVVTVGEGSFTVLA
jgi:hypothetical protein